MAKKVSRRERKRQQETKKPALPHHLLQQGRQELEAGDPRQALEYFKRAQREDNSLKGLDVLLFSAYSLRARQLEAKGMTTEAAAMRDLAGGQRVGIDPQALSTDDFLWYIRHLDLAEAIQVYASWLDRGESSQQAEQILADQLMVNRRWDALAGLGENHRLQRDSQIAKQAIVFLDDGAWEEAEAALRGISRRSPFAPWRLFCKAMTCFGARDDRGLGQALDLLPKHFVLTQVVEQLRRIASPEPQGKNTGASTAAQEALPTAWVDGEGLARELVAAIKRGPSRVSHVERLLPPLAKAIYPEDPIEACVALLEIVGIGGRQQILPLSNILAMRRLLPPERAQAVAARIELINQTPPSHRVWDVAPAATYLAHLDVEFPEAHQQALARARVLEFLARSGHSEGACPDCVGPPGIKILWDLIGEHSSSPDMIFADLMLASLDNDPDNREGYRFLVDLLQGKTSARPRIERTLTEMAARFPDDPDPYLELARLHYSQNAYRKAETALEEARKRAPHDERILDRQAIAYLKSADRSRDRRSYSLAERDLQRAEALGRRRLAPILLVKRLGLELASGPGAVTKIGHHVDSLPPFDQLRALALLILDLTSAKYVDQKMVTNLGRMLSRKKELLDQISAGEFVRLLAPIDAELDLLFRKRWVAPIMSDWWTEIMARAEGDDLFALFDILLDCQRRSVVRAEIDRRLEGVATSEHDLLLRFYLAVILYLEGASYGSQGFQVIVDAADSAGKQRLRAVAARLVPYAHGRLREALRQFEFDTLDSPFSSAGIGASGFEELLGSIIGERGPAGIEGLLGDLANLMGDSGDLFDGDNEDDEIDELGELEAILDEAGMRGAPLPMLQDFVGVFRSDSRRRRELDRLARANEGRYDDLSRELRVLLFPKRSGSRRRTR